MEKSPIEPSMFFHTYCIKWVFLFCFVLLFRRKELMVRWSVPEGGLLQDGESPLLDETHLTILWRIIVK